MTEFCGARTRSGGTCKQRPIDGGNRCHWHGGALPQVKAAAARRLADQRARKLLADLDHTEPVTDPIAALEDLAGQAVALVRLLRSAVADLEEIRYRGGLGDGTENLRGELQAYLAAMARAESILHKIVSLDLDTRRVRLDEARADVVLRAIGRALDRLGLDEQQRKRAAELFAHEFRLIDQKRTSSTPTFSTLPALVGSDV